MEWNDCYARTQEISPRAAKIAARMLRKDPLIPADWEFALQIALTQRAHGLAPFTRDDLALIAANQEETNARIDGMDEDQTQAWKFAIWIRQAYQDSEQR